MRKRKRKFLIYSLSAALSKNILREYPQWSGIGVDKTVDKYVRLDMNYTLPNILILLTLM